MPAKVEPVCSPVAKLALAVSRIHKSRALCAPAASIWECFLPEILDTPAKNAPVFCMHQCVQPRPVRHFGAIQRALQRVRPSIACAPSGVKPSRTAMREVRCAFIGWVGARGARCPARPHHGTWAPGVQMDRRTVQPMHADYGSVSQIACNVAHHAVNLAVSWSVARARRAAPALHHHGAWIACTTVEDV